MDEEVRIDTAGTAAPPDGKALDCRTCGACCAYSRDWPRFTLESEGDLDRIPAEFVDAALSGMRCIGNRCSALAGEVGESASCRIYAVRPLVCRECEPWDDACRIARRWHGLDAGTVADAGG